MQFSYGYKIASHGHFVRFKAGLFYFNQREGGIMLVVDVGYSVVKAVFGGKTCDDAFGGRTVPGRTAGGSVRQWGWIMTYPSGCLEDRSGISHISLAIWRGQAATFTLDREKHLHPNHDVLIRRPPGS